MQQLVCPPVFISIISKFRIKLFFAYEITASFSLEFMCLDVIYVLHPYSYFGIQAIVFCVRVSELKVKVEEQGINDSILMDCRMSR